MAPAEVRPSPVLRRLVGPLGEAHEVVGEGSVELGTDEERAAVARAVDVRRRQFASARACAREGLRRLGVAADRVPIGSDRAPVWPPGVVGSITHTDGWCGAAVAANDTWAAVGIDAERGRLSVGAHRHVLTDREAAAVAALDPAAQRDRPTVVLSAKEAFYKCQHPVAGRRLNFVDVELVFDRSTFAVVPAADPAATPIVRGRWLVEDGLILSAVVVAAGELTGLLDGLAAIPGSR